MYVMSISFIKSGVLRSNLRRERQREGGIIIVVVVMVVEGLLA